MKNSRIFIALFALVFLGACHPEDILPYGEKGLENENPVLSERTVAEGLLSPMGVDFVPRLGGVVIAEAGTGNNDGQISLYRNGQTTVLADSFASLILPPPADHIVGPTHVAVHDGTLWIINGASGRLYQLDLNEIRTDSLPLSAHDLTAQDIRSFVLAQGFDLSNLYNITFDERGNAYLADAGANIVVKRSPDGTLSTFATVPNVTNPAPVGEPTTESVPTSVAYDGEQFLVSAYGGVPFAPGSSGFYRVDPSGEIVDFQDGYTTLVDFKFSQLGSVPFGLQFGVLSDAGLEPGSGSLVRVTPEGPVTVVDSLTAPTGLEVVQITPRAKVFVTSITEGTLTIYWIDTSAI